MLCVPVSYVVDEIESTSDAVRAKLWLLISSRFLFNLMNFLPFLSNK